MKTNEGILFPRLMFIKLAADPAAIADVAQIYAKEASIAITGGTPAGNQEDYGVATNARDGVLGTKWGASNTGGIWYIEVDWGVGVTKNVTSYAMHGDEAGWNTNMPNTWKLQGSNNHTAWTDLDSRSGITWSNPVTKTYTPTAFGNYRYHRIYITALNGATIASIYELYFYNVVTKLFTIDSAGVVTQISS